MKMADNIMLKAALKYRELGFSVIPCGQNKKPLIEWKEFQQRHATEQELTDWWNKHPSANVGIITGKISNICVVDIDDPEIAKEPLAELIPDSIQMPVAHTPSGGQHLFFRNPELELRNNTKLVPGCDFRGEGGYVLASPSKIGDKQYKWIPGLKITQVEAPALPGAYVSFVSRASSLYINKSVRECVESKESNKNGAKSVDTFVDMFSNGRRDEDLFSVANALVKGGLNQAASLQVLKTIAKTWGEDNQDKWFSDKIKSAINRTDRRDKALSEEVREFILSTSGVFLSTDVYNFLGLSTSVHNREDKKNVSEVLRRLINQGVIERSGNKNGQFRVIDNSAEEIDFESADDTTLDIRWPFEIENYVDTYPKSISIIAGAPNAGKTAFLLNFVRLNIKKHKINYFSSEMGKIELKARLTKFGLPLSEWKQAKWKERAVNFADVIKPDEVNVIDFLELHTDFFMVGQMIKDIFDRLKSGIAIIALQKNSGNDHGLGGFRSIEKARLYLAMDTDKVKIVKGKNWHDEMVNPNGLQNEFKLVQGCKFLPTGWHKDEDFNTNKQYKGGRQ